MTDNVPVGEYGDEQQPVVVDEAKERYVAAECFE